MTLSVHAIRARVPWEGTQGKPEIPSKGEAPRKDVPYERPRHGTFLIPLAAEAVAPDDWDCTCGQPARREGAPEGTGAARPLSPGPGKYERNYSDVSPMGQLRKRRSKKQGAAILAEAEERARQNRGAQ